MTGSTEPQKQKRERMPPPLLYALLAIALIALPRPELLPASLFDPASPAGPLCGRIVLVSAARHGSTWFLDSAERCTAENGSFGNLNKETELWNKGLTHNVVGNLTPESAAVYAKTKRSLKIFPLALERRGTAPIEEFFTHVARLQIPVFILRRNLEHSYDSRALARETKSWKSAKGPSQRREIVKDKSYYNYEERITLFFQRVRAILKRVGLPWDEFDYDDIVDREFIVGERNRCYIRNCNFLP